MHRWSGRIPRTPPPHSIRDNRSPHNHHKSSLPTRSLSVVRHVGRQAAIGECRNWSRRWGARRSEGWSGPDPHARPRWPPDRAHGWRGHTAASPTLLAAASLRRGEQPAVSRTEGELVGVCILGALVPRADLERQDPCPDAARRRAPFGGGWWSAQACPPRPHSQYRRRV
jgi:hypothetical protein